MPILVAAEEVAGVDFGADVGEVGAGAVGEDGAGKALELSQVIDNAAVKEEKELENIY